jgi:hypothetical protein
VGVFDCKYEVEISRDVMKTILNNASQHIIPDSYPRFISKGIGGCGLRSKMIEKIGFTLISNDWIIPLSKWIGDKRCIEVMAGCGSLTYALKQQGVNIFATDDFSWKSGGDDGWNDTKNYWTDIENIDAIDAIQKYGNNIDIVFMSWPYMDDTAYRVLLELRKVYKDAIIIYIGEGECGCTADDDFFNEAEFISDKSFNDAVKNYKQWWGIYDQIDIVK